MPAIDWGTLAGAAQPQTPASGAIDWGSVKEAAAAPASPAKPAATDSSGGFFSQVGDAGSALGHHLMNMPHGLAQLIENGIAAGANVFGSNPVSRYINDVAQSDNRAMAERERQYQASTPNSGGAYVGATVGEIAPMFFGGAASKLQELGDAVGSRVAPLLPKWIAPAAAKIASGATQGAVVGAVQPVVTPPLSLSDLILQQHAAAPSYWDQKRDQIASSAALGGAVPIASQVARSAYGSLKNVAAPLINPTAVVAPSLAKWATNSGQDSLEDVVKQLRSPEHFVEGSTPTTAQVLANPTIVSAEKAMANNPSFKPQFEARNIQNNAARIAAVQGVAGTPDALQGAVDARTQATQPLLSKLFYDATTSQPVPASAVLSKVNELENSSFSTDPVIKRTLGAIRSQIADAIEKTDTNSYTYTPSQLKGLRDAPYVRADLLDGIRQNLRGTLRDNASDGIVSSKQSAGLEPLADHITSAIDEANPGYRDYLATYAQGSRPINTMEAAGSILDNVAGGGRSADASGAAQVTLAGYRAALARALSKSPYGIDPAAQSTLEGVQSDLQRASISNSIRSPGSDTSYNLQAPSWLAGQLYGKGMTGAPALSKVAGGAFGALGGYLTGGGFGAAGGATAGATAVAKLADMGQSKVNAALADALLNPQSAADMLAALLPQKAGPTKAAALGLLSKKVPQVSVLLSRGLLDPQINLQNAPAPPNGSGLLTPQ